MAVVAYPGTPGTVIYGGLPTPTGGTLLTTITLVNDTLAEQPGGFVTPMFGQPFVQGDIPSGEWPQLETEDGVPVPYTHWGKTTWPDGSLKWLGFMARFPQAVPALGLKPLRIKNGGAVPTSGARTLGDATSADLNVLLTGVTNLTGEWGAYLNDAIAAADDVVTYGSGPAGALYRVGGPVKQAGSPHGQIYCWTYFAALQNSSGGLLGLRHLHRVAQPWGDVASPTPTRRVVNASLRSGTTVIRTLQGHDTTETPGANIGMPHYTSFFTAGADGRWDFAQGGGSASADCVVRVVHDKAYFVKSRLVPPYNTAQPATSSTSVDYVPYTAAGMLRSMGNGGERNDIGVLTSWAARHLLTQAAVDERVIRVVGLASGGWRTCLRKQSTKQVIPVMDPSPSYTGLGTVQTTWRYMPNDNVQGVVSPVNNTTLWVSEYEPSHRPAATYYPYLVTGEPQYLDMLTEQAAGLALFTGRGSRTMNVTPPITVSTLKVGADAGESDVVISGTTYKGGGWMFTGYLIRNQAWMLRDIAEAAAIYPDTCPQGTEVRKYLREVAEAGPKAVNAYNTAIGAPWSESGIFCFDPATETASPWLSGYMSNVACHAASILPNSEITAFRQHLSRHWSQIAAACDLGAAVSYRGNAYDDTDTRVSRSDLMLFQIPSTLTFSTATNRFTVGGVVGSWSPTNGDVIAFDTLFDADKPFVEATNRRRLYVVNASGNTGQLSLTPGGSPITVTSNAVVAQFWARLQNFAPHFSAEGDLSGPDSYIANISGAIRHHKAVGDLVEAAETEVSALLTTAGTVFTADPKNALAANYPV